MGKPVELPSESDENPVTISGDDNNSNVPCSNYETGKNREYNNGLDNNQFRDHYELGEAIGRGHFGSTYYAKVKKGSMKGQRVAVKVISISKSIEDVKREVKILRDLKEHENLVQFYGAFKENENVYIAMELCEGGNLLDNIPQRGVSEDKAKDVMVQILSVVASFHVQGVVHRDLKPENFVFTSKDNSTLKAIDFGLSEYVKPDERLNARVGTLYYVAPEVLRKSYGTQADMWSIGVIAYQLLCGSLPFEGSKESKLFRAILHAEPSFAEVPWQSLSPYAMDFVKILLNKDYWKRPTAAQALSHPWLANYQGIKIPLDMIIYNQVKAYIGSSSLRKAALRALAKTLPDSQFAYFKRQFKLLGGTERSSISTQDFVTAVVRCSSNATKDARIIQYASTVSSLEEKKFHFEEFCGAAISVHQIEAMGSWEERALRAYNCFEKDGNRPIRIEELTSELGLSPSEPVHVVSQKCIREDGSLSFLGFERLLFGFSSRPV